MSLNSKAAEEKNGDVLSGSASTPRTERKKPICAIGNHKLYIDPKTDKINTAFWLPVLVIGMAGSGKTTLMQRLNVYTHEKKRPTYVINLDPGKLVPTCLFLPGSLNPSCNAAVKKLSYSPHIDIRDTVNYKQVMKQ